MDSEVVDRLIVPGMADRLPADLMKRLDLFTEVAAHIVIEDPLPASQPELEARTELPPFPDLRASLDAALDYWAAKRGGFRNRAPRPVASREVT
jgi:hypothetical protein